MDKNGFVPTYEEINNRNVLSSVIQKGVRYILCVSRYSAFQNVLTTLQNQFCPPKEIILLQSKGLFDKQRNVLP